MHVYAKLDMPSLILSRYELNIRCKKIANLKSVLPQEKYSSKQIKKTFAKRNNKIRDYLHKASTYLVNQLVSDDINTLVLGYNKEWKQDISMGKVTNQNFVGIPFYVFKGK